MSKKEFLSALEKSLAGLSKEDIAERLAFYSEAVDDRVEEGYSEEEAVAQLGSVSDIAARIFEEIPGRQTAQKMRRLGTMEIILLILGSPIWISLLAAAFSVVISLYAALWSLVISAWATQVAIGASCVGCFIGAWIFCFTGNVHTGLLSLAVSLFCGGFSILLFYGCKVFSKAGAQLTIKTALWLFGLFVRKEAAK